MKSSDMILANNCYLYNKCGKYKNGKCDLGDTFCLKLFKINELYNKSLLTEKQRLHIPLYFDKDRTDSDKFVTLSNIEKNIVSFVESGKNIYLHSIIPGNGKSSWAIRMCQAYINNIWHKSALECKVLFISVPRFLLAIKDNISNKSDYAEYIKENVLNADLVVWDDIATKSATVFEAEHLLSYIDTRINDNKSNIYTSNLDANEIQEKLGPRLYSRIVNYSTEIELNGKDKRGINR